MFKVILLLFLSSIGAFLYRIGGKGKPFNTLWRDLGVPIIATLYLLARFGWHSQYLIHFGWLWLSCTTYNKWASQWWYPKWKEDVYPPSWFVTGLLYGLAAVPLVWVGISLWLVLARAIALAITTMAWSELISDVEWEERGRGFLIVFSLLIFK